MDLKTTRIKIFRAYPQQHVFATLSMTGSVGSTAISLLIQTCKTYLPPPSGTPSCQSRGRVFCRIFRVKKILRYAQYDRMCECRGRPVCLPRRCNAKESMFWCICHPVQPQNHYQWKWARIAPCPFLLFAVKDYFTSITDNTCFSQPTRRELRPRYAWPIAASVIEVLVITSPKLSLRASALRSVMFD